MDIAHKKAVRERIDSLTKINKKLSEKLTSLKKEKQLGERELRSAYKLLAEIPGTVVLVQEQHIVFANEMASNLLGYTKEELLSRDIFDLVHSRSSDYDRAAFRKVLSGEPVQKRFDVYMKKKNGESLCCESYWKKIRYLGRTAYLFNLVALDQRKREEKEYSQNLKLKVIARMASGLSYDIDSILKTFNEHFSQLMRVESLGDKAVVRSLRRFEASIERGNHILRQLKCLTKTEEDPSDVLLFDPKKVVQDAVVITSPAYIEDDEHPITVKTYLRTLSPVEGHPDEIRDAFVTMLFNAFEAMPEGGEVYLTAEENSGYAWFYLQDSGLGVPENIKEKIFDPFFTTKGRSHAGLGLSLAFAIISRHGGKIELVSQEGQGATFIVKLPISQQPAVLSRSRPVKNRIRDSHILIISADSIAADLLVQEVIGKGGKIAVVYSFTDGLKLLRKKPFNLVIADCDCPDMDLTCTIQEIRRSKGDVPIVLFNAGDYGMSFHILKELGADLIIERPLELDRITSLISETIAVKEIPGKSNPPER